MILVTKRESAVSASEVIGAEESCRDVSFLPMKKRRMIGPSRDLLPAIGKEFS